MRALLTNQDWMEYGENSTIVRLDPYWLDLTGSLHDVEPIAILKNLVWRRKKSASIPSPVWRDKGWLFDQKHFVNRFENPHKQTPMWEPEWDVKVDRSHGKFVATVFCFVPQARTRPFDTRNEAYEAGLWLCRYLKAKDSHHDMGHRYREMLTPTFMEIIDAEEPRQLQFPYSYVLPPQRRLTK